VLRPRKPRNVPYGSMDVTGSHKSKDLSSPPPPSSSTRKDILAELFEVLSIPKMYLNLFPKNGIEVSSDEGLQDANDLVNKVLNAVSLLVLQDEDEIPILKDYLEGKPSVVESSTVSQRLVHMSLLGNSNDSTLSQSVLATVLDQESMQTLIRHEYSQLDAEKMEQVAPGRLNMGEKRHLAMQDAYDAFLQGDDVPHLPRKKHKSRVNGTLVARALDYLKRILLEKTGGKRTITVADHEFTDVGVYNGENILIGPLSLLYKQSTSDEPHLDFPTFRELFRSITNEGASTSLNGDMEQVNESDISL
jgi:hypothetical protein